MCWDKINDESGHAMGFEDASEQLETRRKWLEMVGDG
jgi:hypothetical protein